MVMDSTAFWCFVVPGLAIIGFIALRIYVGEQQRKQVAEARAVYDESLRQLRAEPHRADRREYALRVGRAYSALTRRFKGAGGVTIYDEMAIGNDIQAAVGTTATVAAPIAPAVPTQTVESKLASLKLLLDKGMITQSEYDTRRQKLLDDLI